MQILQEVQRSLSSIGFNQKLEPFNRRIVSILVTVLPGFISVWVFLIHEADSAQEYMESIYIAVVSTGILLSFTSTISITKKLFSFIENIGECFKESE